MKTSCFPLVAALALLQALAPCAGAQEARRKQEILFAELPARTVGDAPFELAARATSGLPVSFEVVEGPAILDGRKLRLTHTPGLVVVRATQPGNAVFAPAKPEDHVFVVNRKPSAPSFVTQPRSLQAEVGSIIMLSADASGEPVPSLQWRKEGVPLAGASGRTLTIMSAALPDAGNYDIVAVNPSGSSTSARVQVAVTKRRQTISFQGTTTAIAGQPLPVGASASSGLPVRLEVVSGMAMLSGSTLTAQAGMVVVQASQEGDANYEAAAPVNQTFTISPGQTGQHFR